jgi:iron(II)-dependent oxidoreductase
MTSHVPGADRAGTENLRDQIAQVLIRARGRTVTLTDSVGEADLVAQHSRLMSPLVWDLAHIANQEELWLVRGVGGREPVRADIDQLYDAFRHARADRPALPLLDPAQARGYAGAVREKVWDVLSASGLRGSRLVEDGFAFGMIAQHEQQHDETMLATHQLRAGTAVLSASPPPSAGVRRGGDRGRRVHHGYLDGAVGPGQRAARASGVRSRLRDRCRAGDQRAVSGLHRRWRV